MAKVARIYIKNHSRHVKIDHNILRKTDDDYPAVKIREVKYADTYAVSWTISIFSTIRERISSNLLREL